MNVGIFIHDGVELLDFAGPGQVFASVQSEEKPAYEVFTIAANEQQVISQRFLQITPNYAFFNHPSIDILVLPGGDTHIPLADSNVLSAIEIIASRSKYVLSVCTGVFFLARLGLLNGLKATTHTKWIRVLQEDYPRIHVEEFSRYTDNGKLITTQGISAGIDGALYLVEKLNGSTEVDRVRKYLMYETGEAI